MIRVGVLGAAGRMGRHVCGAVAADPELQLVAAVDPRSAGRSVADLSGAGTDVVVDGDLAALTGASVEVAVDFTRPDSVMANLAWLVEHDVAAVVGTTGVGEDDLASLRRRLAERGDRPSVLVAPNFAIGAVLMMRFAQQAARFMPAAEIVELHHDGKLDAPSGTAATTARRIAAARGAGAATGGDAARGLDVDGVRIHSVRLPGLVAHQEVILGGQGQTLTIRHDSIDRTSFMPGVLLAIKRVRSRPGLTIGLDALLE